MELEILPASLSLSFSLSSTQPVNFLHNLFDALAGRVSNSDAGVTGVLGEPDEDVKLEEVRSDTSEKVGELDGACLDFGRERVGVLVGV